jgi:hypothetical protein
MASDNIIRVGIVGASANRGFAAIAHIPALRSPPSSRSRQSERLARNCRSQR